MRIKQQTFAIFLTSLVLLISACGGSDSDSNTNGTSEIEPNNTPANAQVIAIPVTITGRANDSSDEYDAFSMTLGAAGTYSFTLDNFDPTSHDLDLGLYDSGTNILNYSSSTTSTESFSHSLDAGVVYYIVVDAWDTGGNTVSYRLNIQ